MIYLKSIVLKETTFNLHLLNSLNKEELAKYYNLFVSCFGERSHINLDTFEWFNNANPLSQNYIFCFTDASNEKLVASYGLLPVDLKVENRFVKTVLCTNVMTHPEFAGLGIFKSIGKNALEFMAGLGYELAFGVPNEQAIKGHLSIGWEIVNTLNFFQAELENLVTIPQNENCVINKGVSVSDAKVISNLSNNYKVHFNRTNAWINWRIQKPFSDFYTVNLNSEPETFAIIKKYTDSLNNTVKFHVVDFCYSNLDQFKLLMSDVLHFAKSSNGKLINMWNYIFNQAEIKVLSDLGFIKAEHSNPIIFYKLNESLALPEGTWHITLFDNDVY